MTTATFTDVPPSEPGPRWLRRPDGTFGVYTSYKFFGDAQLLWFDNRYELLGSLALLERGYRFGPRCLPPEANAAIEAAQDALSEGAEFVYQQSFVANGSAVRDYHRELAAKLRAALTALAPVATPGSAPPAVNGKGGEK